LVFGVNGAGNSVAKKLVLARALPTAPTALVLRDGATVVTKLGVYAGNTTPLTLTATAFTTQGGEATSFRWVLPAGVNVIDGATLVTDNGATKTYSGTATVLTVNLAGVTTATSLALDVFAVNGAGTSTLSRKLTVSTALPSPVATVSGLIAVCNRSTGYNYTITAPIGANRYLITAPAGSVVTSASVPTNASNTLTTTDLTFNVVYSGTTPFLSTDKLLKIQAGNAIGFLTTFKSLTLTKLATCPVVREENASANAFSVNAYPNPSSDVFNVSVISSSKETTNVKVYDMTGRLIENRQENAKSLQVGSRYAAGAYNVIVKQGANTKTVRVIKK
jgi:hypothetical protein